MHVYRPRPRLFAAIALAGIGWNSLGAREIGGTGENSEMREKLRKENSRK